MTRAALITTTINIPHVLTQWAASGMTEDDVIIVAGDYKSPHNAITELLNDIQLDYRIKTQYLSPSMQTHWAISEVIGWNCIQRRNIALLEAMNFKPKYIVTVDDDNFLTSDTQFTDLLATFDDDDIPWHANGIRWMNPGFKCDPPVHHRGYPIWLWHNVYPQTINEFTYESHKYRTGVSAMLWTGDPDIDAIERIVNRPNVYTVERQPLKLAPGTWAPFNTQATAFLGELAPFMLMWPHVGRYDDIWASYTTRRAMDHLKMGARYGYPIVQQDRNEHDLVNDLEQEIFGMKYNENITDRLRSTTFGQNDTIFEMAAHIFDLMSQEEFLPVNTRRAFSAWIKDLRTIGYDVK